MKILYLREETYEMNTRDVIIAACFLLASIMCVLELIKGNVTSYFISGTFIFALVSSLFFRKAKTRK